MEIDLEGSIVEPMCLKLLHQVAVGISHLGSYHAKHRARWRHNGGITGFQKLRMEVRVGSEGMKGVSGHAQDRNLMAPHGKLNLQGEMP
jgi:hypothetical protein